MAGQGVHLALSREEAKQLFGQPSDEEVLRVLSELAARHRQTVRCHESGPWWDPIHRCLTDGTLRPDAGEYPLNQCVLGGRPLLSETSGNTTVLVRPDLIPHLVKSLDDVTPAWMREQFEKLDDGNLAEEATSDFSTLWTSYEALRTFFRQAAEDRHSVVFSNHPMMNDSSE